MLMTSLLGGRARQKRRRGPVQTSEGCGNKMGLSRKKRVRWGLVFGALSGCFMGCNQVPEPCKPADGKYMIMYTNLDGAPCNINPLVADVGGDGRGVMNQSTQTASDKSVVAFVTLRGCSMTVDLSVSRSRDQTKLYDILADVDLRSDNADNLSGVGHGLVYDRTGQVECEGLFGMQLSLIRDVVPANTEPPAGLMPNGGLVQPVAGQMSVLPPAAGQMSVPGSGI